MKKTDSMFTAYEFTDDEFTAASVFPDLQLAYLRNLLCLTAETKMKLSVNPELPNSEKIFVLEQEYYRGQIELLQYILNTHEENATAFMAKLQAAADRQQEE